MTLSEPKKFTFNDTYNQQLWDAMPRMVFAELSVQQSFLSLLKNMPIGLFYKTPDANSWFSRCINSLSKSQYRIYVSQEYIESCYQIIEGKFKELIESKTSPEDAVKLLDLFHQDTTLDNSETKHRFMIHLTLLINKKWPFQQTFSSTDLEGKSSPEDTVTSSSHLIEKVLTWNINESMPILFGHVETKELLMSYLLSVSDSITGERQYHHFLLNSKINDVVLSFRNPELPKEQREKNATILLNILEIIQIMQTEKIIVVGTSLNELNNLFKNIFNLNSDGKSPLFTQNYLEIINNHFDLFMQAYNVIESYQRSLYTHALAQEFDKNTTLEQPPYPELALKWLHAFSHYTDALTTTDKKAINSVIDYIFRAVLHQENGFTDAKEYLSQLYSCLHENVIGITAMLISISDAWKKLPNERAKLTLLQEIAEDNKLCEFFAHCFARLLPVHINNVSAKNAYLMFTQLREVKIGEQQDTNNTFYTKLTEFGKRGGNSGANVLNAVRRGRGFGIGSTEAQKAETDGNYVKPSLDTLLGLLKNQPVIGVAVAADADADTKKLDNEECKPSYSHAIGASQPYSLKEPTAPDAVYYANGNIVVGAIIGDAIPAEAIATEEKQKVTDIPAQNSHGNFLGSHSPVTVASAPSKQDTMRISNGALNASSLYGSTQLAAASGKTFNSQTLPFFPSVPQTAALPQVPTGDLQHKKEDTKEKNEFVPG